jgi:ribonuclease G
VTHAIAINSTPAETRVAIVEDGRLAELFVERSERDRMLGTIVLGKVVKVLPSMQAAFVDVGFDSDGFLPFDDARPPLDADDEAPPPRRRGRQSGGEAPVSAGERVAVQVVKEPIGTKGARLTMQLSLPGRYMVLLPRENTSGVSRRIGSTAERRRLKDLARELKPEGFGIIIRTVAEDHSREELEADLKDLLKQWQGIRRRLERARPGDVVHREPGMVSSIMRDLFTADLDAVICDNSRLGKEIRSWIGEVLPTLKDKVEIYDGAVPLFDRLGIEEEIDLSLERKVWFKGGGYLIIEQTEAMIVIDVNSGRYTRRSNLEENALQVNLEAARELCRQLRLRDLGGLVVIDFIDMQREENRTRLLSELRALLKKDRAQADVAPVSRFGLVEMTRERVRPALIHSLKQPCRHCGGTGLVSSKETLVTELERWLKRFKAATGERRLVLRLAPSVHDWLSAGLKSLHRQLMWRHFMLIRLEADPRLDEGEFRCFSVRQDGREVTAEYARGLGRQGEGGDEVLDSTAAITNGGLPAAARHGTEGRGRDRRSGGSALPAGVERRRGRNGAAAESASAAPASSRAGVNADAAEAAATANGIAPSARRRRRGGRGRRNPGATPPPGNGA